MKYILDNQQLPEDLGQHWLRNGVYFGYPLCCIAQFINGFPDHTADNKDVGEYGFQPCDFHAKLIREGKATLAGLISNRLCLTPFPDDGRN